MTSVRAVLASLLVVAAFGAATAQASEWSIQGKTLAELKLKEEKISGSGGTTTFSVPSLSTTIKCLETKHSGKIFEGGGDEIVTTLSKCEVVKVPTCKVTEPVTIEAKTQIIAAAGVHYAVIEALKEGKPLTTISLTGAECALPLKNEVKGSVAASISLEEVKEEPLKFSEELSTKVNSALKAEGKAELKLTYGTKPASLSGEAKLSLSGAHAGELWQDVVPALLCKKNEPLCEVGESYGIPTTLKLEVETATKFVFGALEPSCTASVFEGTTTNAGPPLRGTFTTVNFTECVGGLCPVRVIGGTPFSFELFTNDNGNGSMTVNGNGGGNITFEVVCGGLTCQYRTGAAFGFGLFGGAGATPARIFRAAPVNLTLVAGAGCAGTAKWEGVAATGGAIRYNFALPNPMYMSS